MKTNALVFESVERIVETGVSAAAIAVIRLFVAGLKRREVVGAQHHVLRRGNDRFAGRWRKNVVARQHQHPSLGLRFNRQRHMDSHLVTVEVSVECRTDEGVELDGTAIHQFGFEGLNAETVQRWSTVQHDRVTIDHLLQNLHHLIIGTLDEFLCRLDVVNDVLTDQAVNHERLEQLDRHLLGQAALMHLQLRTNHDH